MTELARTFRVAFADGKMPDDRCQGAYFATKIINATSFVVGSAGTLTIWSDSSVLHAYAPGIWTSIEEIKG